MQDRFNERYAENTKAWKEFWTKDEAKDLDDIKADPKALEADYAVTKPKAEAKKKAEKKEGGQERTGSTEDLLSLYSRISEAAAQKEEQQVQKDQLEKLGEIADGIGDLVGGAWDKLSDSAVGKIVGPAVEGFMDNLLAPSSAGGSGFGDLLKAIQDGNTINADGYKVVADAAKTAGALK
jgi:hypothetical protein